MRRGENPEKKWTKSRKTRQRLAASIVDIFCGAGGLSHGFRQLGFDVVGGIDIDENCRYAFERNNGAPFIRRDVATLKADEINCLFTPGRPQKANSPVQHF